MRVADELWKGTPSLSDALATAFTLDTDAALDPGSSLSPERAACLAGLAATFCQHLLTHQAKGVLQGAAQWRRG